MNGPIQELIFALIVGLIIFAPLAMVMAIKEKIW